MEEQNKSGSVGFGVASMVLGIISILCSCCFYYISLPCAILGILFAAIAMKKGGSGKGMGIAGLVTSIIALLPSIIALVMGGAIMDAIKDLS